MLRQFHELKRQYETVSIGGLSLGAVLSLSLAAELKDEVAGLTLFSTTLFYDGWNVPWYRKMLLAGYYTPLRYLYAFREGEPYGLKDEQLRKWVAHEMMCKNSSIAGAAKLSLPAMHEAALLIESVKDRLPQVTAPALILHAEEDDVSNLRSAHYVADHIGSEKVESIILHDSYHMITIDKEREKVAAETIRFLDSVIRSPHLLYATMR